MKGVKMIGINNNLEITREFFKIQPNGARVAYCDFTCKCGETFTTNKHTKTTRCKKCSRKHRSLEMIGKKTPYIIAMNKANKKTPTNINGLEIVAETEQKGKRRYFDVVCGCGEIFNIRSDSSGNVCKKCRYDSLSKKATGRKIKQPFKISVERITIEAKKYTSRYDFQLGAPSEYSSGHRRGILDSICKHMKRTPSDADVVYIWKVVGSKNIYKAGYTSRKLGDKRIKFVAKESGFDYDIVIMAHTGNKTRELEKKILKLGKKAKVGDFSGSTEFVELSQSDIKKALKLIKDVAVKNVI